MSAENIKLIQDVYARFLRGDLPGLLDMCRDDVTWGMIGREHDVPMAGIRTGKNGVIEFFTRLKATQQLLDFAPRNFVADDDTVCCIGHTKWKMHQSGVSGENDWVHVFTLRDGKIAAFRGHQDTGQLAEAYHALPAVKRAANF